MFEKFSNNGDPLDEREARIKIYYSSSLFFNLSLHMLELYIYIRIIEYLCARPIYSYKSALANIALWPTISSSFSRFFSLDSNAPEEPAVEYILGRFLSNYESSNFIYIHTYNRTIRLVIEERWISSGSIGRDDWPPTGCFHHG